MFGVGAFMEEFSWVLVIGKLSFFKSLVILSSMCANPLAWWKIHEGQFLKVGFLAKQVFRILGFHIETKKMLNLVGVLTTLRCHYLEVQNLDQIIIIINNQPNDLHMHFTPNVDLKDYLKTKVGLIENSYELIEKVEYFEELHVVKD